LFANPAAGGGNRLGCLIYINQVINFKF